MNRHAFALRDLVSSLAIGCIGAALLVPSLASARGKARGPMDQAHLGLLIQGFNIFASANQGSFPLPSRIDTANTTIARAANQQLTKDNTGNIFSFMIYSGYSTPEQLVSPVETHTAVVSVDTKYEFDNPQGAAVPKAALWDPRFAGTPLDNDPRRVAGMSNQSYAHLVPGRNRANLVWTNRWHELEPIISNRGPQYSAVDIAPFPVSGRWSLIPGATGTQSYTLGFYGKPNRWEGYVAYNDGHVGYETEPTATNTFYRRTSNPFRVVDNIFVSENDEGPGSVDTGMNYSFSRNAFLRPVARVSQSGSTTNLTLWRD